MNLFKRINTEKILWVLGLIAAFLGGRIYSYVDNLPNTLQTKIVSDYIYFPQFNKGLYLKKKVWGMTSDRQIVFITKDKDSKEPDFVNDIVFEKENDIFYKITKDSLIIYSPIGKDISNFKSDFKVKLVELENPEFMNLHNQFHESLKPQIG